MLAKYVNCSLLCQFCHVMWVRKRDPEAEWQEFATLFAALYHMKSEGAPLTLQQVQIERAAEKAKPRNGFVFSFKFSLALWELGRGEGEKCDPHSSDGDAGGRTGAFLLLYDTGM